LNMSSAPEPPKALIFIADGTEEMEL